jgi:hypothetical protein
MWPERTALFKKQFEGWRRAHLKSDWVMPVPLPSSRARIAARRKAGGFLLYTEYDGVDRDVWQWTFTEVRVGEVGVFQRRG